MTSKNKNPEETQETGEETRPEVAAPAAGEPEKQKPNVTEAANDAEGTENAVAGEAVVETAAKTRGRSGDSDRDFSVEEEPEIWVPKTSLGRKVYAGEIASMTELMKLGVPIKETGIVDKLLPGLKEEIVDVGRVQRVTDSGRRMRFRVVAVVGNGDGYIGIGEGKGKEVGPAIRHAIEQAKLTIKPIKRGCGSWECGCGKPHSVPVTISGKAGSVTVTIKPAPQGVSLVSGEVAKKILGLAGIKDAWVQTDGHTRTGINFAHAMFNALIKTNEIKVSEQNTSRLKIVSGSKGA